MNPAFQKHIQTQLAEIKAKITHQIEEKVSDGQRKFFLNEQLKAITEELGLETDDKSLDLKLNPLAESNVPNVVLNACRSTRRPRSSSNGMPAAARSRLNVGTRGRNHRKGRQSKRRTPCGKSRRSTRSRECPCSRMSCWPQPR